MNPWFSVISRYFLRLNTTNGMIATALQDFSSSIRAWRLWTLLGWVEIRQRYARSKLGPFWVTISMGVLVGTLGIVYGALLNQSKVDYLPLVAVGIVMWGLFSGIVGDGCNAYIGSANYIRNAATPRLIYVLQVAWRNLVLFAHNFIIIILVLMISGVQDWAVLPLFIPGLIVFLANSLWMAALFGLLSARFRDLPQIILALLQVAFYVTPILFHGSMLSGEHHWIVAVNPLAYMINIVRQPLLGEAPSTLAWSVTIVMAVFGWVVALMFTGRYHKRIPYWV